LIFISQMSFAQDRLRMDLSFIGNSASQSVALSGLYHEPGWSGSPSSMIEDHEYGSYWCEVFAEDSLIYSRGFNTLFEEWLTTPQARHTTMSSSQSVCIPFPQAPVRVVISYWGRTTGEYTELFTFCVDPSDRHIVRTQQNNYPVDRLLYNGDPSHKADIAIIAEGYTASQMDKFRTDAARMMDYVFTMEPYKSRKSDFNVWLVESPSLQSGVSVPQDGVWKSTVLGSMYDTFYIDRYLTVMDHSGIASAASGVPYDALIVLANSTKYGGGGFYNSYAIAASDDPRALPVFIHEFGHSFAGLGDEYFDSEVAYEDYYPAGVEPWEPNITTLVDFSLKWGGMIAANVPVPTPATKKYEAEVGVFEGAGYMTHGCYRPYQDCRMKTNTAPAFCPVCQKVISERIDYYCK